MHKSLNRIFKTLKEHNTNANNGTHPDGYYKAGMKSLQRPQRAPPSPPLPISMSYHEKKSIFMSFKSLFQNSNHQKIFKFWKIYTPNP